MKTILLTLSLILALFAAQANEAPNLVTIKTAIDAKQFDSAAKQLAAIADTHQSNPRFHYLNAKVAFEQKDYKPAIESYKKAAELDDQQAKYFAGLGTARMMLANQGNPMVTFPMINQGVENYKHALTLDPNQVEAHMGLARFYTHAPPFAGGSLEKAAEHAEAIKEANPHQSWVEHGLIADKAQDHAKAVEAYDQAIQTIDQPYAWLYFQKAKAHQKAEQRDQAKAAYQKALELDPNHQQSKDALANL